MFDDRLTGTEIRSVLCVGTKFYSSGGRVLCVHNVFSSNDFLFLDLNSVD